MGNAAAALAGTLSKLVYMKNRSHRRPSPAHRQSPAGRPGHEKIRQDKTAGVNNNIAGYTYAGKTGTAQWYKNGVMQDTHLVTFAGLIPANEPRLAILVKLNEPKIKASNDVLAGTTALPVWRDVAEQAVKLLNIPPDSK